MMRLTRGPDGVRTIVDDNAEGGWIVEIHDGTRCETWTGEAETADDAVRVAREQFNGRAPATFEPANDGADPPPAA